MSGGKPVKTYKVALGTDPFGAKQRQGDHKTPEGVYSVDRKLAESEFGTNHPTYAVALANLGTSYRRQGRYAEARQQLQSVLAERAPSDRPRWTLKEVPRAKQMLESIRDKK